MSVKWIKLTDQLPQVGQLCFIRRYKGSLYIGNRTTNQSLVTDGELSDKCYWCGAPIEDLKCTYSKMEFGYSFNDQTVLEWIPAIDLFETLTSKN